MSKPRWGETSEVFTKGVSTKGCIDFIIKRLREGQGSPAKSNFLFNKDGTKNFNSVEEYKEALAMLKLRNL